jgi:hypothetical protein
LTGFSFAPCYNGRTREGPKELGWVSPPGKPEPLYPEEGGKRDVILVLVILLMALVVILFSRN